MGAACGIVNVGHDSDYVSHVRTLPFVPVLAKASVLVAVSAACKADI